MQMGCLCTDVKPASKRLGRLSAVSPPVVAAYIFYLDTRNYQTSPGAAPYSYMSVPLSAIGNQSFNIPNAPPDAAVGLNNTSQVTWYASIDQFGDVDPNAYKVSQGTPPWSISGVLQQLAKAAGGAVQGGMLVQTTDATQFETRQAQIAGTVNVGAHGSCFAATQAVTCNAPIAKPTVQAISPTTSPTVMSQSPAAVQVECVVPASFSTVSGQAASGNESCANYAPAANSGSNLLPWLIAAALVAALVI
jgi:hypothetical protein